MAIGANEIGKAALAIAGALIVGSIGWSAASIVKLDKAQALTEKDVTHVMSSIELLVTEMRETRSLLDESIELARNGRQENARSIRELDALIKQIGANLESQIQEGQIQRPNRENP